MSAHCARPSQYLTVILGSQAVAQDRARPFLHRASAAPACQMSLFREGLDFFAEVVEARFFLDCSSSLIFVVPETCPLLS